MNAETSPRDNGNLWVVVPFVLALLGTIVMLFTNSANMLKVSLILALWAAAAGIILTSRLRRDRDEAKRQLDDREERHKAELEAAQARGEADRAALALARNDEDIPVGVDVQVLREIQAELAALRAQLEEISGRQFEYEPAALRAEARRIAEIGAPEPVASTPREQRTETVIPEPAASDTSRPFSFGETRSTGASAGSSFRSSNPSPVGATDAAESVDAADKPSAADTTRIQPVRETAEPKRRHGGRPAGAPTSDAISGRLGTQPSARSAQHNPLSQLISERQTKETHHGAHEAPEGASTGWKPGPQRPAPVSRPAAAKPAEPAPGASQPVKTPKPAQAPKPADTARPAAPKPAPAATSTPAPSAATEQERRGGRRRRDERSGAVSVAELLARRGKESE